MWQVCGFFVTPRTISARVLLPEQLLPLWGQDEAHDPPLPENIAHLFPQDDTDIVSLIDTLKDENLGAFFAKDIEISTSADGGVPIEPGATQTMKNVTFTEAQESCGSSNNFCHLHPVTTRGRRAHITLAVAPQVPPVTAGYDLLQLQKLEQRVLEAESVPPRDDEDLMETDADQMSNGPPATRTIHEVDGVTIADYGHGIFAIYLPHCLQVTTLFSTYD